MATTVFPKPATEPGALDGFAYSCDEERCAVHPYIGTSTFESNARQLAEQHQVWHEARR